MNASAHENIEVYAKPDGIREMADVHLSAMVERTGLAATTIVGGTEHAAEAFGPPTVWGSDDGALWTDLVKELERLLSVSRDRIGDAQGVLHQLARDYETVDENGSEAQKRACPCCDEKGCRP